MQNKKLKLSTLLIFYLALSGLHAQSTLFVKEKAGNQTTYALTNIRKLTFAAGNMAVNKTGGGADSYTLANIRYMNFKDLSSGILLPEIKDSDIVLYPNPVTDELQISLNSLKNNISQIEIIEIQGIIVYRQVFDNQQIKNIYTVNLSRLPEGLYICRLQFGNNVECIKFIKN